jgi:hypothetical protein
MKPVLSRCCLVLCTAFLLCGCSLFHDEDCRDLAGLRVTISASGHRTSRLDPVIITVTAENTGDSRVVWGYGSSTCQLGAVVRIDGADYRTGEIRGCTQDVVELWLDPGQTRTESWGWYGGIWTDQGGEVLPAGRYRLYGTAGSWVSSNGIVIEVFEP